MSWRVVCHIDNVPQLKSHWHNCVRKLVPCWSFQLDNIKASWGTRKSDPVAIIELWIVKNVNNLFCQWRDHPHSLPQPDLLLDNCNGLHWNSDNGNDDNTTAIQTDKDESFAFTATTELLETCNYPHWKSDNVVTMTPPQPKLTMAMICV